MNKWRYIANEVLKHKDCLVDDYERKFAADIIPYYIDKGIISANQKAYLTSLYNRIRTRHKYPFDQGDIVKLDNDENIYTVVYCNGIDTWIGNDDDQMIVLTKSLTRVGNV